MHRWRRALITALALAGALAGSAVPAAEPPAAALPRIVVAFANEPASAPGPAGSTGHRYAGGAYGVSQSAALTARHVASDYGLREVASWPIRELAMHCVVYEIVGGRPSGEVLAALARDPRVALAQPLNEFHTLSAPTLPSAAAPPATPPAARAPTAAPAYDDPLYDLQTNLPALGVPEAHRRAQGAGIRIALIDTAVDAQHPDLAGRIVRSRSFVGANRGAGDSQRHGTAMAGIIAAVAGNGIGIVGIAPRAELEVYAACWQLAPDRDDAACNTFTLARALAAALESGAPLVNVSVAGPEDALLTALIATGVRRGVIFVGATTDAGGGFPAGVAGVLGAAGSEAGVVPPGALAAPARHVLTLRPGAQYDFESGTSVSAAEITGVIALLMSATRARLPADAIRALLQPPSTPVVAGGPVTAVNAAAALARLDSSQQRTAGHALDGL